MWIYIFVLIYIYIYICGYIYIYTVYTYIYIYIYVGVAGCDPDPGKVGPGPGRDPGRVGPGPDLGLYDCQPHIIDWVCFYIKFFVFYKLPLSLIAVHCAHGMLRPVPWHAWHAIPYHALDMTAVDGNVMHGIFAMVCHVMPWHGIVMPWDGMPGLGIDMHCHPLPSIAIH